MALSYEGLNGLDTLSVNLILRFLRNKGSRNTKNPSTNALNVPGSVSDGLPSDVVILKKSEWVL